MRAFDEIRQIAAARKGGAAALDALMSPPLAPEALAGLSDDRWLSAMARSLFQAGFNWKVIDAKWPGFEAAFDGFAPARVAAYHDDDLDRLLADKGVVRNGAKLAAVIDNARLLTELAAEHGSAARCFADWPAEEFIGLLDMLAKRGARMGGVTGQRMLRAMGKDGFVLSADVVARLIAEGVVDKQPTSRRDMAAVQAAFNIWRVQSGRPLTEISRTLAFSVGP